MNQTDYFTEKIATLPEDLQDAIRASNHEAILKDIQREYKLHIDQAQILETLAIQLIFGDIDAPQFVNNMFNEAHVSSSVAGDILLKIDVMILKKIRSYMEEIEEMKKRDAELQKLLMSEEEQMEEDEANIYAAYYADMANTKNEVEQELLNEGFLPDGSNITDEVLAKELGISVEELVRRSRSGGIKEAREKDATQESTGSFTLGVNTHDAKAELLHELESPEKSFIKPLFTPVAEKLTVKQSTVVEKITLPDHQLQNTHLEKPLVTEAEREINIEQTAAKTTIPSVTQPTQNTQTPITEPVIKKPTKLVLPSIDPYKEPIE